MRPATLYTLKATEILAGDYHRLVRFNLRPVFTTDPNEAIAPMNEYFEVPIHRVTRCIKPRTMPIGINPWEADREDVFFALEPALREILEAPFVDRAEQAEKRERAASYLLQRAEEAMTEFNNQPWWKRAWVAVRYGVTY